MPIPTNDYEILLTKKYWKRQFYVVTGGRPMQLICESRHVPEKGKPMHRYLDKFGRVWLAAGPWARFRVPRTH